MASLELESVTAPGVGLPGTSNRDPRLGFATHMV